jgi:hypothetical protein
VRGDYQTPGMRFINYCPCYIHNMLNRWTQITFDPHIEWRWIIVSSTIGMRYRQLNMWWQNWDVDLQSWRDRHTSLSVTKVSYGVIDDGRAIQLNPITKLCSVTVPAIWATFITQIMECNCHNSIKFLTIKW